MPVQAAKLCAVSVMGRVWNVAVRKESRRVSIASGEYDGQLIETKASSDLSALSRWQAEARARANSRISSLARETTIQLEQRRLLSVEENTHFVHSEDANMSKPPLRPATPIDGELARPAADEDTEIGKASRLAERNKKPDPEDEANKDVQKTV